MDQNKSHTTLILSLLILVLLSAGAFWYFFIYKQGKSLTTNTSTTTDNTFLPFGRPTTNQQSNNSGTDNNNQVNNITEVKVPSLRLLSATPVGGYGASTTASTTIIRWIDRGRGNILETSGDSIVTNTISNTLLPRTYESIWNKNLTGFIGSILGDNNDSITTIFASIIPQSTSSSSSTAPYELRGKSLPEGIAAYSVSPKRDKIFFFVVKNETGFGYTAPFSGGTATQIFKTPITKINVEWPEENIIAITTKGSANQNGFLYFVNPKTGVWKKIVGPVLGLSTRISHDGRYALLSATGNDNNVTTSIYSIASSTGTDAVIRTLADKCVWGNFYKNIVYCAVPFKPVSGTYPDDWYKGSLSTIDKIWQVNAITGEIHLISSVFSEAERSIDAFNLSLDDKDDFLYFMNKNDLSLWSLDLVAGNK